MLAQALPVNNKDRLINARKNRQLQLERWDYYEKENSKAPSNGLHKAGNRNIQFSKNIILLEAVSRNDIKEVTELLKQGVDPNSVTIDGLTGLHQCCIDDYPEMGTLLLKYKADVNAVDSEMWTPLHAAATCGNVEMCKLLIKFDADFLAINADGNMPYDICEGNDTLTVIETEMAKKNITQEQIDQARLVPEQTLMHSVKQLIEACENLDQLDSQGATMLHIACSLGFNDVVRLLLEASANHSVPDREGWLPIHIAACWNYLEIVEFLVAYGANIDDTNSNGDTVFEICEPQFKDRLVYIKNNVETIRNNFDFRRLPQCKSFRKSRGSSIRRSSVRHKNMMSRKEAKEEFLTMNQPVIIAPDEKNEGIIETVNDEDNSDVDNCEITEAPKKSNNNGTKTQASPDNKSTVHISKTQKIQFIVKATPSSPRNSSPKPKKETRAPAAPSTTDVHPATNDKKPNNHDPANSRDSLAKLQDVQSETSAAPSSPSMANKNTDPVSHPRYVFTSTLDNWDVKNENKKSRRRRCCVIL